MNPLTICNPVSIGPTRPKFQSEVCLTWLVRKPLPDLGSLFPVGCYGWALRNINHQPSQAMETPNFSGAIHAAMEELLHE